MGGSCAPAARVGARKTARDHPDAWIAEGTEPGQASRPIPCSMRASEVSRPRTSRVSNRSGPPGSPVRAQRSGWKSAGILSPRSATQAFVSAPRGRGRRRPVLGAPLGSFAEPLRVVRERLAALGVLARVLLRLGLEHHGVVSDEEVGDPRRQLGVDADALALHRDDRAEPVGARLELVGRHQAGRDHERRAALGDALDALGVHVLAGHPQELVEVEDRPALADVLDVEPLDELLDREDLGLAVEGPALQRQEVQHGLGRVALAAVVLERGVARALAELLLVGAEHQGQVPELRRLRAEGPVEQDLLGRVDQVLLAAEDVRDAHVHVVADDDEVVRRVPVATDHDPVVDLAVLERHLAADQVREGRLAGRTAKRKTLASPDAARCSASAGSRSRQRRS